MEPFLILAAMLIVLVAGLIAFVPRRRPPRQGRVGRPGAEPSEGAARTAVIEAPPEEAPPELEPGLKAPPLEAPTEEAPVLEPAAPPRLSVRERLGLGLLKSRRVFAESLAAIIRRDRLDADAWDEVEEILIRADVGAKAAMRIVEHLRDQKPSPATLSLELRRELVAILGHPDRALHIREESPSVWLVTGVNGVGKTTTIGKLAHRLLVEGRTVVLAAGDTFRAAAIEQLGTWAQRVGVHMVSHASGADPGAVVFDAIQYAKARSIDVVLVDTAGRLHTKTNLMEELKKVRRVAEREAGAIAETLLVLDATVGQNGIAQARTFREAVDVTGLVLTKVDGSARGGVVIAVEEELGIPVKAVGMGESLEDLAPFEPEVFVDELLDGRPSE